MPRLICVTAKETCKSSSANWIDASYQTRAPFCIAVCNFSLVVLEETCSSIGGKHKHLIPEILKYMAYSSN
jgi:hypothetical protein